MVEEWDKYMGCAVTATASQLAESVEQARQVDIDAAVLDINLAGELSYPIAEALLTRDIPFVFTTGYARRNLIGRSSWQAV